MWNNIRSRRTSDVWSDFTWRSLRHARARPSGKRIPLCRELKSETSWMEKHGTVVLWSQNKRSWQRQTQRSRVTFNRQRHQHHQNFSPTTENINTQVSEQDYQISQKERFSIFRTSDNFWQNTDRLRKVIVIVPIEQELLYLHLVSLPSHRIRRTHV